MIVDLSRSGTVAVAHYPYSPEVNAIIKEIPGREWKPAYKVWTLPATPESILLLKTRLAGIGVQLRIEEKLRAELNAAFVAVKEAGDIRAAGDAQVEFDFKTEPYAHQRAGLAFLARLGSGALFWEMGLGKTKTAIDYAEWLAERAGPAAGVDNLALIGGKPLITFRVLVIAPNTVKRNWGAEIQKHARHDSYVIPKGTIPQRIAQLGVARYTIVNTELLQFKKASDAILDIPWDLVIADESTRFKTPGAARTKALLKLARKVPRRVILTGTPITGKPEDAWAQLEIVQPGLFGSYWSFTDKFLKKDHFGNVIGIQPDMVDELKKRIDSRGYRILKDQVLDLPPKIYADRTVEMTGDQKRAYNQMRDELRIEIEGMPRANAANILTLLLRLTQVTAGVVGGHGEYQWLEHNAKAVELDALLNEELAGEQVVVYGNYQFELEQLAKRYALPSIGLDKWDLPPIIYGPTPEGRRHELVEQFQRGDRRLLFVQARTGGIGITLTAARTAIYYTRSWSLEEYLQSQDRLHRIGQTRPVSIIHLLAEGSIDDDIKEALEKKQDTADDLTGDKARKLAQRILGM